MKHLISRILFVILALMAILIGLYPFSYFIDIQDKTYGLFGLKQKELLENILWNIAFYSHIVFGGIALLIGWVGFIKKLKASKFMKIHRSFGKTYVIAVFISSLAGIYIGFLAEGGIIAKLGFITLGIVWFYTTLIAYKAIRNKKIEVHQKMMIYSYATCFAAVTLRFWMPFLENYFKDFETAYKIVAWLCWLPNLFVAYLISKKTKNANLEI